MALQIKNSDEVTSLFGYWPEFCDAKINYFSFEESKSHEKCIQIRLLYLDVDKSIGAQISFTFADVSKTDINTVFDENVLDELVISKNDVDSNYNVELQGCYGLSGQFNCKRIEVNEVTKHNNFCS